MKRIIKTARIATLALIVAIGLVCRMAAKDQIESHIFTYSSKELAATMASKFKFDGDLDTVRRDSLGTGLRFIGVKNPSGETVVMLLSNKGQRMIKSPGRIAYLNDQEGIVAWSDDFKQGIHLGSYMLRLPQFALFDIDPGGNYFIIGEKPCTTWIGRVDMPDSRVCLSTNFLGSRLFERAGQLLVCGGTYQIKRGSTSKLTACLVVEKDSTNYKLVKQVLFPQSGGVIDVDPFSERFLLETDSDIFSRWYIYDIKTNKKTGYRSASEAGFFLTNDVLRRQGP